VVTFPVAEHHHPLAGTKLYCLVTEVHRCEQLAQGCCAALPWVGFEPTHVDCKSNALHVAPPHYLQWLSFNYYYYVRWPIFVFLQASQDSQNSQIWPTAMNACILSWNTANPTTFIHYCQNNSIYYKIQHGNDSCVYNTTLFTTHNSIKNWNVLTKLMLLTHRQFWFISS